LTKLQVILYYSNSSNTYNNWLFEIINNEDFSVEKYTDKVLNLAKAKFRSDKLFYPEISIFDLYFIDFLLWKLYKAEEVNGKLKSLKSKIDRLKEHFNKFKFKQLSSREHLLSTEHAKRRAIDKSIYN